MTDARAKHTQQERTIAKQLGLTDAQLDALLRIKRGYWPGNAAACLLDKGLAYREKVPVRAGTPYEGWCWGKSGLTEAGEAKLTQARNMGF